MQGASPAYAPSSAGQSETASSPIENDGGNATSMDQEDRAGRDRKYRPQDLLTDQSIGGGEDVISDDEDNTGSRDLHPADPSDDSEEFGAQRMRSGNDESLFTDYSQLSDVDPIVEGDRSSRSIAKGDKATKKKLLRLKEALDDSDSYESSFIDDQDQSSADIDAISEDIKNLHHLIANNNKANSEVLLQLKRNLDVIALSQATFIDSIRLILQKLDLMSHKQQSIHSDVLECAVEVLTFSRSSHTIDETSGPDNNQYEEGSANTPQHTSSSSPERYASEEE